MKLGRVAQVVQDCARLHASRLRGRVELENAVEVLRRVEDNGDVAALAGEARPRSASQNRSAEAAAQCQRFQDVVAIARHNDTDRHLAVVRGVRCIERAASGVEADFAANTLLQLAREAFPISFQGVTRGLFEIWDIHWLRPNPIFSR